MLMWNPSKLTTAGKALLAKAQAGQTSIQITKAQTGSGSYSSGENIESRTALKTPKQTFPIQNKVINDADNTVILKIAITNKSEEETLSTGYDITEFGIFAQDPQKGEILYSIATASTSDYMPAYNGVLPSVINMSYYLEVSNAENVTINSAGALALQADLEALEARVTTIEKNKVELLGVRRKVGVSSSTWERIGDAQIGHLHLDHLFTDGADRRISEKVYIPIFPGSIETVQRSVKNSQGTYDLKQVDILRSKAGVVPAHNKTRGQFRTLCKAKGDNWYLDDVWAMHFLDTCFLVMFANSNAQATLGSGRTEFPEDGTKGLALQERTGNYITVAKDYGNRFAVGQAISIGAGLWSQSLAADRLVTKIEDSTEVDNAVCVYFDGDPVAITSTSVLWSSIQPTGATIGMAAPNGRVEGKTNGMSAIRFLWIEDWYGNMWQFRDGDNIQKYQHYYCNDRSAYADKVYDGSYFKVGYVAGTAEGYVKTFGFDPEWPEIEICTENGASSNTYFCDYYYAAEGGEVVLSGGNVNIGPGSGPFYRHCDYSAAISSWNFGGRPQARK